MLFLLKFILKCRQVFLLISFLFGSALSLRSHKGKLQHSLFCHFLFISCVANPHYCNPSENTSGERQKIRFGRSLSFSTNNQITKMFYCGFVSYALCTSYLLTSWPLNIFHFFICPQHTSFSTPQNLKLPSFFPKFPQCYPLFAANSESSTEQLWFRRWRHTDPSANQKEES